MVLSIEHELRQREEMLFSQMFEQFVAKTPISVAARAAMEYALAPAALDGLFGEHAKAQYTRELLFSSVVDLMSVVVAKIEPSVHAAYQEVADTLPVALTSVYNKLNGVEPAVTAALVHHTAERLGPVVVEMKGQLQALLPGHRVRIIDGNHFAATERRLDVLRGSKAGPLPGQALVILDPSLMLATEMIPCEDGHAQERSMTAEILGLVVAKDVWIADRNFCTRPLLEGIGSRDGFFVVRQHLNLPIQSSGTLRRCGQTDTGELLEQSVTVEFDGGGSMKLRRVVLRLDAPTRDGDAEIAILTNLPARTADGIKVAELYRDRWTLETMFQSLTAMLAGELNTLGYPRAALLGFGVALTAYNVLSTVQASLRAAFGADKVQEEVSGFYLASAVRKHHSGMKIALKPSAWKPFRTMTPAALAIELVRVVAQADLKKFKRHPRGPKNPVPKRTRHTDTPHVSTARLLAKARKNAP